MTIQRWNYLLTTFVVNNFRMRLQLRRNLNIQYQIWAGTQFYVRRYWSLNLNCFLSILEISHTCNLNSIIYKYFRHYRNSSVCTIDHCLMVLFFIRKYCTQASSINFRVNLNVDDNLNDHCDFPLCAASSVGQVIKSAQSHLSLCPMIIVGQCDTTAITQPVLC